MLKSIRGCFRFSLVALLVATLGIAGCGGGGKDGDGKTKKKKSGFMKVGSAPSGGTFFTVGSAIAEALNKNAGDNNWDFSNSSTNGSQANIRLLQKGELDLALSNAAITYFAVRGEGGWDQKYDMQAVVTLAPNVAMFISRADSDVKTIKDLKGKRVTIGPSGAGFKMFVAPILKAHGITYDDFQVQNSGQSGAVENLGDGATDAAFLGGAIPTASIQTATNTFPVHFIPFDAGAHAELIANYPFFTPFTVPANTYKGLDSDFQGLNVGSMHLITSKKMDEETIYQITKTIWESRAAIRGTHPAGKAINKANAARDTGTEFHPGAIRFYKEIGIWKARTAKKEAPKKEAPKKEAPKKEAPKKEAPKKEAPKKEAPKKEAPKKEAPKKEAPKKEAPKKEAPKKEAPKKEAPKKEAPKKEAPKKEAPKKEAPKKEAPKKEAPKKEAPKKEAPKKEAPKKEAPKKEAPKKDSK